MLYLGSSEVLDFQLGGDAVKRVYAGSTLSHEFEADLTTALPSWISYSRVGTAYRWVAGTNVPKLATIAADTARFDLDWKDGTAIGLLMEDACTNLCGFNRGAAADGWTASSVTVTNVEGADQSGTEARRLAASGANATYTYTHALVTGAAAGVYVFGGMVRRQAGYGRIWLQLTYDTNQVEERDISADLQAFKPDNVTPRFVPVFVSRYCGANAIVKVGFKIETSGDAIDVDFPQLELSPNGRGYPTSPISTAGATSASRNADRLFIVRTAGTDELILTGEELSNSLSEITYRDIGDWRDREERHIRSLRCVRTAQASHDWRLTLSTPAENRPNSGYHPGAPSAIVYEDIYPDLVGHYSNQLIPLGYSLTRAFADTEFVAPALSSCTGTPTAYNTATLGVTTANDANGTLYWVVSTSATAPSIAQMKAGKQADGSAAVFAANAAVASTGVKIASATGLSATTNYYTHAFHEDAARNPSAIATSGQWTTPSAYTPTAIMGDRATGKDWFLRRATPGFATSPHKMSYCIVFEATGLTAAAQNFICNTSINETIYANYNTGSPQKISVRQAAGGLTPISFTFNTDIGLTKCALFVAVDYSALTGNAGKLRVRAMTSAGLLDAANDKVSTDTFNLTGYNSGTGINLGNGASYQVGLLKSATGTANPLTGKIGLFWLSIGQFIDWDTQANRDALVEIQGGVLRPVAKDVTAAANGAVAGITPDVWAPFHSDPTDFAGFTPGNFTAYNRGSLSTVTLTSEVASLAGNW